MMCAQGWERKCKHQEAEETQEGDEVAVFHTYGRPLSTISPLKYTGRVITSVDDEWAAVILNLRKVRKRWVLIPHILGR